MPAPCCVTQPARVFIGWRPVGPQLRRNGDAHKLLQIQTGSASSGALVSAPLTSRCPTKAKVCEGVAEVADRPRKLPERREEAIIQHLEIAFIEAFLNDAAEHLLVVN